MSEDPFGYKAAKKLCNEHNNTLTYEQLKPCAIKGKHSFSNYYKSGRWYIGTCTVCGWKYVMDGNI